MGRDILRECAPYWRGERGVTGVVNSERARRDVGQSTGVHPGMEDLAVLGATTTNACATL
jgi:hypothetical protein